MKIVVVGAGAIGLASAYALAETGADVHVVDPRGVGGGASRRNAGWVVPMMSGPVPAPGVVSKSLRWMLRRDSPLYVRPSFDPQFIRFMLTMLRACNERDYERGLQQLCTLNAQTEALYQAWERAGMDLQRERRGILMLFKDESNLQAHALELHTAVEHGLGSHQVLTLREARSEVHGLSADVVGAIDCSSDSYLDPGRLMDELARACVDRGVAIHSGDRIDGLEAAPGRRVRSATGSVRHQADYFVVAAGVWTPELMKTVGVRVAVQAGKGYGFDVPDPSPSSKRPDRALYLSEARVAITPMPGRTRLAGTMAFGGLDESVDARRASGILKSAGHYLSGWPDNKNLEPWSGLRPMTPDGLPLIGRVPEFDNLLVATGHAMAGITLAPVTGSIIARIVSTGTTPAEALPFDPARFVTAVGYRSTTSAH